MTTLTFLGTGNAFNEDGYFSTAVWIETERRENVLVDAGPTTLAAMRRAEVDPDAVDAVFITHLHGDHIAGWPFLVLDLALRARRERPLDVYGPIGTQAALDALAHVSYGDAIAPPRAAFETRFHELDVESRDDDRVFDSLAFAVVPVEHHPSSLGYLLSTGGHRIGITGDTGWCSGLEELAQRSSLLVAECTTVDETAAAHLSLAEFRARRGALSVERIVLVHTNGAVRSSLRGEAIPGVVTVTDGEVMVLA